MSIIRTGTGIFEQSSLRDRVDQAGIGQPTSAKAAAGVGASPMEAAMAGSRARKDSLVQEQTTPKELTELGFGRLAGSRQEATSAEQEARQKAADLKQLGSLQTRVQSRIEQKLNQQQAAQTTGQVRTDFLAMRLGLTPEQAALQGPDSPYQIALAELQILASSPTPEQAEQAYVNLINAGIPPNQSRSLVDTTVGQIGQTVAEGVQDTFTIADLDLTDLNALGFQDINQLASLLNLTPEEASGLSLQQLSEQAELLRQSELNRVNSLRAEISSMPLGDPRRRYMVQQLRDLGYVGVTGLELEAVQSVDDIQTADLVTIGGVQTTVGEALKDENISSLIERYLVASPEEKAELLPPEIYGDLRQWVDTNRQALIEASEGLRQTAQQVQTVQQQLDGMSTPVPGVNLDKDLLAQLTGMDFSKAVTQQELNALQDALDSTGVGQLILNPDENTADILNKINPSNLEFVKNATSDELSDAHEAAKLVINDQAVKNILGIPDIMPDFITNPAQIEQIRQYSTVFSNLRTAKKTDWFDNDAFMALSPADMQVLIDNPDRFENFSKFSELKTDIEQAKSTSDILNIMFDMNEDQFTEIIAKLDNKAIVDPSVRPLRDELKKVQAGLSAADPKDLLNALLSDVSVDDFVNGTGEASSLMNRLNNLEEQAKKAKLDSESRLPDLKQTLLSKVLDDKKLTPDELSGLNPTQISEAYSLMSRLEGVDISAIPPQAAYLEGYVNYPADAGPAGALKPFITYYSKSSATEEAKKQLTTLPTVDDIAAQAAQIRRYWYGGADTSFKLTLIKDMVRIKNDINTKADAAKAKMQSMLDRAVKTRSTPGFGISLSSNRAKKEAKFALDKYIASIKETLRLIENQRSRAVRKIDRAVR